MYIMYSDLLYIGKKVISHKKRREKIESERERMRLKKRKKESKE